MCCRVYVRFVERNSDEQGCDDEIGIVWRGSARLLSKGSKRCIIAWGKVFFLYFERTERFFLEGGWR